MYISSEVGHSRHDLGHEGEGRVDPQRCPRGRDEGRARVLSSSWARSTGNSVFENIIHYFIFVLAQSPQHHKTLVGAWYARFRHNTGRQFWSGCLTSQSAGRIWWNIDTYLRDQSCRTVFFSRASREACFSLFYSTQLEGGRGRGVALW